SYASYIPWLAAAGIWLAVTSVAAWRRSIATCVGLLALGGFGATQIALIGHRTLAAEFSAAPTVAALRISPPAAASIFAVEAYDHSIAWSLRRTVTMVGYKDELGEAIRWEPQKFIPDLPGFARAWIAALSRVPVSVAYPMLSIGYVVNAIAAWYLLGEAVTPMRLAGIGIIVLGVFIVARS